MPIHLIRFGPEQVDVLALEGWTSKEIGDFAGLSRKQVIRMCRVYPDGPQGWLSRIHKRKARLRNAAKEDANATQNVG